MSHPSNYLILTDSGVQREDIGFIEMCLAHCQHVLNVMRWGKTTTMQGNENRKGKIMQMPLQPFAEHKARGEFFSHRV
jgi:hypothetical protein